MTYRCSVCHSKLQPSAVQLNQLCDSADGSLEDLKLFYGFYGAWEVERAPMYIHRYIVILGHKLELESFLQDSWNHISNGTCGTFTSEEWGPSLHLPPSH